MLNEVLDTLREIGGIHYREHEIRAIRQTQICTVSCTSPDYALLNIMYTMFAKQSICYTIFSFEENVPVILFH